jgi:predicted GIY-YIG superfamily endonuclease
MPLRPSYVYRLFDSAGHLLYIGRSSHPETRIQAHRRCTMGWELDVDHWTIQQFSSSTAALRGQRRATSSEHPLHADASCIVPVRAVVSKRSERVDVPREPVLVAERSAFLYRVYDIEGVLQYIGQTTDVRRRIWDHIKSNRFPMMTYTTEEYPTREAAAMAERAAIKTERPLHNRSAGGELGGVRPRFTYEQRVALSSRLLDQLAAGDITYRSAIAEMVSAGYDIWRAADLLGLKNGWPTPRRTCPTVDAIMALNGLT